jgi:hypothetical protein
MRRFMILLLVLLPPGDAAGQFNPNSLSAYQRRQIREKAVAWAGPQSRAFVETGDDAALAVLSCSPLGARKLVAFHDSGLLGRLARPSDLLRIIALYGDNALLFAIQHAEELRDPNCFQAFMTAPLDYALGLKSLDQGVAEARTGNLGYFARSPPWEARTVVLFGGIAAIAGLMVWRWRRKRGGIGV